MAKTTESARLFDNPLLEAMTHVHPITPLLMWSPFCVWLFVKSFEKGITLPGFIVAMVSAFIVWSFTEYAVHRYLFHFPAKSKFGKRIIFLFHGIHHDYPDDATRLVMPPVPALFFMVLFYALFSAIVPAQIFESFMAFFIIGYLCYDYIHYATHHFPMKSKVGRYLRKYHLRHHHSKEESKYGVSNPLWDYVLGTVTGPKKETK